MYLELGELFDITEYLDLPDLFHVHKYDDINSVWKINNEFSTINFPKRKFSNHSGSNILINTRENTFEKIRFSKFVNFPSRFNCLFVCEFDQTFNWKKRLQNKAPNYQLVIVKLLSGKLIKLDDCFFESISQESDESLAKKYWGGNECQNYNMPVFLFEGIFTIKEVIEDEN